MRILFVSSECAPFAKAGGLADVVGALPKALKAAGHDVRILIPKYGFIAEHQLTRRPEPLAVPVADGEAWCAVWQGSLPGSDVPMYFLEHDALFGTDELYAGEGTRWGLARFVLLSRAAFNLARQIRFDVDVFHVHDWPTAWLPIMLNEGELGFEGAASVLTIHNMAHQPRFDLADYDLTRLPKNLLRSDGVEDHGLLNPMKGGLYHATKITTVSPTYAQEIRSAPGGAGLEDVLTFRGGDLVGIVNGIDEDVWNPVRDPWLEANYGPDELDGKRACKMALQHELGLAVQPDTPLIGMVSRLTRQKGTDVVLEALDRILDLGAQVVILGSGSEDLEVALRERRDRRDGRFAAWVGYDEGLAHRIEAGCDLFLMPSRFEPCGLNQMYSQRYGTLPVVRATGGLEDTVQQLDLGHDRGDGFKFYDLDADALVGTLRWALRVYREHPDAFVRAQRRAMRLQMGWDRSAQRYLDVYRWSLESVRGLVRS